MREHAQCVPVGITYHRRGGKAERGVRGERRHLRRHERLDAVRTLVTESPIRTTRIRTPKTPCKRSTTTTSDTSVKAGTRE